MANNPVREAITSGKFCYIVELVASAKMEESKVLDIGSALATVPGVIAASVTSYAGGSAGHDPIRIATGIKERGLTPNVHMTCVQRDRVESRKAKKAAPADEGSGVESLLQQLDAKKNSFELAVGTDRVKLTHLDRVYWPENAAPKQPALSKRDLLLDEDARVDRLVRGIVAHIGRALHNPAASLRMSATISPSRSSTS